MAWSSPARSTLANGKAKDRPTWWSPKGGSEVQADPGEPDDDIAMPPPPIRQADQSLRQKQPVVDDVVVLDTVMDVPVAVLPGHHIERPGRGKTGGNHAGIAAAAPKIRWPEGYPGRR